MLSKNRAYWNATSDAYQATHGVTLTENALAWGVWRIPEPELQAPFAFAGRLLHPQPLVPHLDLMKLQVHGPSIRWRLLWHRAGRVLQRDRGKSTAKSNPAKHFTGLLVLRGSRRKSARFSCRTNNLPRLRVLRSHEQDSTEMQCYPVFNRFYCKVFLTDALEYLGGATATCMIDNTHVVVASGTGARMVPAPEMAQASTAIFTGSEKTKRPRLAALRAILISDRALNVGHRSNFPARSPRPR